MYEITANTMIGAFRKVAKLVDNNISIDMALLQVAREIEFGMEKHRAIGTKSLTINDVVNGKFIGDLK